MSFIKEKLKDVHLKRQVYHEQRLKKGMPIVSLVGYTSSGKTTLFNLLTKENKETSSDLFTTLSTTMRSMQVLNSADAERDEKILIVDTVGFISRLPHYMIDAFKSTLEESLVADLILLLIDCSESIENIGIKYYSCWQTLNELKVDKSKVYVVLSKADNIKSNEMGEIVNYLNISAANKIFISSKTGYGIHKLRNMILSKKYMERQKTGSVN